MSAELIDPFAVIQPATPLSPERVKDLTTDIYAYAWDDRTAVPELLGRALRYIEGRALVGDLEAIQTLDVMAVRSTSGIPFGEPVEPTWSLDPEVRIPRRGERASMSSAPAMSPKVTGVPSWGIPMAEWLGHWDGCSIQWSDYCDCGPDPVNLAEQEAERAAAESQADLEAEAEQRAYPS